MSKASYLSGAFTAHKIVHSSDAFIGSANFAQSEEFFDSCVVQRIAIIERTVNEMYYQVGDDEGLKLAQTRQIISYPQYISTIKSVDTIRSKIAEAEQEIPEQYVRLSAHEDKTVARIFEKKTGINPTDNWKKADKINELRRKLYTQYDATTLQLVREYNPAEHTPDRVGYFKYLYKRDPKFLEMFVGQIPIMPEPEETKRHTYITGGSGSGKSELLKVLIHSATKRNGEAVVVIDPHGDLTSQIAKWEMFSNSDRLLYIDPYLSGEHIPPFNPFDVAASVPMQEREVIAQQLVDAFEQLLKGSAGNSLTVNMRTVLTPCILTLLDRPNSTMADLQRFMDDRHNQDLVNLGRQSKRGAISRFFEHDYVNDGTLQVSKTAVSRKLQSLFNTYAFDEVVNSKNSIDFGTAVNSGKVILLNLSKGRLGSEASEAFGRLIVATIQGLALRRANIPEQERVPLNLFIDECQNYISDATIEILEEARKYAVNMTLAQQVVGRGMSTEVQTVVLNNTNIKMAGRTPEDAKMAKILGKEQSEVQKLATGSFWMKVGNGSTFLLKTRSDFVGDNGAMTNEAWASTMQKQLTRYRPLADDAPSPTEPAPASPHSEPRKLI